jgi:hypothetical protein
MAKYQIYMWVVFMILVSFVVTAYSQEDTLEINSEALGRHTRPVVNFPHIMHEEQFECSQCHHDYDDSGDNAGSDGGYCSDCHTKEAADNRVSLVNAFHLQCKQCHAREILSGKNNNIPQMCGQCHSKS